MRYYYNEQENSFYISTNFTPTEIPQGYVEITKEQYEEMTSQELDEVE